MRLLSSETVVLSPLGGFFVCLFFKRKKEQEGSSQRQPVLTSHVAYLAGLADISLTFFRLPLWKYLDSFWGGLAVGIALRVFIYSWCW